MKLKKVISGGQTGADRTGLECARELGLETGGMVPKGWKTDEGPDSTLRDFGLVESMDGTYPPRTRANVKNADCTLWFGETNSPGYWCTQKACKDYMGVMFINPDERTMRAIAANYEVINVAGNRARTNPKVVDLVRTAFGWLKDSDPL